MAVYNPHPLISHQPFRSLFKLSYFIIVLVRLPYYAAISLIPSLRPFRTWTAKQTFMSRLVHSLLDATSRVGITETLLLEPGKESERFRIVSVPPAKLFQGPLASEIVKPEKLGGTWYPKPPGADITSKRVILCFHGGAFIQGNGRTSECGPVAKRFMETGTADAVFAPQYRLSGHAGLNPFPAALQDALSSYVYLLDELHIPADQIIFAGDSAGANLATALLRYLHEYGPAIKMPNPKCAVLFSPWVDPFYLNPAGNANWGIDFVPVSFGSWGAHAYAGTRPHPEMDPYIVPLGNPFPTPVPLFVNAGTAELFFERITRWASEMRAVGGNIVELHNEENAVHDTFFVADLMGFEDSAWLVATKVAEFVKSRYSK